MRDECRKMAEIGDGKQEPALGAEETHQRAAADFFETMCKATKVKAPVIEQVA